MAFTGTLGTLIVDDHGWDVISEPAQHGLDAVHSVATDYSDQKSQGLENHVRNFLDCVRTRKDPVSCAEAGHLASSAAHLETSLSALNAESTGVRRQSGSVVMSRPMGWFLACTGRRGRCRT